MSEGQLLTLKTLASMDKYPFSLRTLTRLLAKRRENGLDKIFLKIGQRLYVREDAFDAWINSRKHK